MEYLLEILKAILYGLLFGVTDWLPVSSEAHTLLLHSVLPLDLYPDSSANTEFLHLFTAVLRISGVLAVTALFFKRIWPFSKTKSSARRKAILRIWLLTLLGAFPLIILFKMLAPVVESHLSSPFVIAGSLILVGIIMVAGRHSIGKPEISDVKDLTPAAALRTGCVQALAVIPGMSRSGTALLGGQLSGMSNTAGGEFSCYLAIPAVLSIALLKLTALKVQLSLPASAVLFAGGCSAFIASFFAVRSLLNYLRTGGLRLFGYYRIAAGLVILILILIGSFPEGLVI